MRCKSRLGRRSSTGSRCGRQIREGQKSHPGRSPPRWESNPNRPYFDAYAACFEELGRAPTMSELRRRLHANSRSQPLAQSFGNRRGRSPNQEELERMLRKDLAGVSKHSGNERFSREMRIFGLVTTTGTTSSRSKRCAAVCCSRSIGSQVGGVAHGDPKQAESSGISASKLAGR